MIDFLAQLDDARGYIQANRPKVQPLNNYITFLKSWEEEKMVHLESLHEKEDGRIQIEILFAGEKDTRY